MREPGSFYTPMPEDLIDLPQKTDISRPPDASLETIAKHSAEHHPMDYLLEEIDRMLAEGNPGEKIR